MRAAIAIAISTLMLVSTTSYRLSTHHCGGKLVSWSLVGDAEPCAHATAKCGPLQMVDPIRGCCSDEAHIVEGLSMQVVPAAVLTGPAFVAPLLATFIPAPAAPELSGHRSAGPAHGKAPPLRGWEIHIRERSILI
ncbi:MAG: hypothetical protein H6592_13175 [Flavobacteriales bacterium]|nr:hypothetical protein [Flavobacteriales bacterium]